MKFTLEIGDKEKSHFEFSRNWITGSMRAFVDGRQVARQSPFSIFTHFSFRLRRRYEFMVGSEEKHKVVLEKQRPLLFVGFRSQMYRVFVDDKLVHERQGF